MTAGAGCVPEPQGWMLYAGSRLSPRVPVDESLVITNK